MERLQNGEDIAVITDAGMPGISDPGEELVKMCQEGRDHGYSCSGSLCMCDGAYDIRAWNEKIRI